jgi:hypothetical protein
MMAQVPVKPPIIPPPELRVNVFAISTLEPCSTSARTVIDLFPLQLPPPAPRTLVSVNLSTSMFGAGLLFALELRRPREALAHALEHLAADVRLHVAFALHRFADRRAGIEQRGHQDRDFFLRRGGARDQDCRDSCQRRGHGFHDFSPSLRD